jgi:hypothetical protein
VGRGCSRLAGEIDVALATLEAGRLAEFAVESAAMRARVGALVQMVRTWLRPDDMAALRDELLYDLDQSDRAFRYILGCLRKHRFEEVHRGTTPLRAIEQRLLSVAEQCAGVTA